MAIVDLYSKRLKRENGEAADVFQYEGFPEKLKVQIIQIFEDVYDVERYVVSDMGMQFSYFAETTFSEIVKILRKEYAKAQIGWNLPQQHGGNVRIFLFMF